MEDINKPKRFIIVSVGTCIVLVAVVILLANWNGPAKQEEVLPMPSTPTPTDSVVEHPPVPTESHAKPILRFDTGMVDPIVIWQQDSARVYVQKLQLIYTPDGVEKRVLHAWENSVPSEAWINGDLMLIGSQLIDKHSTEEGYRGEWVALQAAPKPEILAKQNTHFGPQEVLTAKYAEHPQLFYAAVSNGDHFSEYLFDPLIRGEWNPARYFLTAEPWQPLPAPVPSPSLERMEFTNVFPLPGGESVYAYHDDRGSTIYAREPFPFIGRTNGYTLEDAKWMPFVDNGPQVLGKFRDAASEQSMAFLSGYGPFPLQPQLWEGEWQALDERSFVQVRQEELEIIQYPDQNVTKDSTPHTVTFSTAGFRSLAAEGSLATYEKGGQQRNISYYDLANTVEPSPVSLWLSPLSHYKTIEEPHVYETTPYDTVEIPVWNYREENTNAAIPEALNEALNEVYMPGDYGAAIVYRKFDERWFVLVDRQFYEYKEGKLRAIGEMPVTILVRIGEAAGGEGPQDLTLVGDSWYVADTQASRVLKLNDRLEVQAELEVPSPYQLIVKRDRLEIASTAERWTTDLTLKKLDAVPSPYVSTARMKKTKLEPYWPKQWYKDPQSGLTWYYLYDGMLYQYNEQEQKYRSFYIGYNKNELAQGRILPYRDEVLVLLDRRLERFDRQGNRLGAIEFPRSRPDGIYDQTPRGENSMHMDEESGRLILVQGFRILEIDLAGGGVRTIFRQNYADIGNLIPYDNGKSLYFLLNSNLNFRYIKREREDGAASINMYTEVVRMDLQDYRVQRFVVEGYFDRMTLGENASDGGSPSFVLRRFT